MEDAPAALVVSDILPAPAPKAAGAARRDRPRERERKRKRDSSGSGSSGGSRRSSRVGNGNGNGNGIEAIEHANGNGGEDMEHGKGGDGGAGSLPSSASLALLSPSHSSSFASASMEGSQDLAADVEQALRGVSAKPSASAPAKPPTPVVASAQNTPVQRIMETPVPIPVPLMHRLSMGLLSTPTPTPLSAKPPTALPASTVVHPPPVPVTDDTNREAIGEEEAVEEEEEEKKGEEEEDEDEEEEDEDQAEDQTEDLSHVLIPMFLTADQLLKLKKREYLQRAQPNSQDISDNLAAVEDPMELDGPERDKEAKITRLETDRQGQSYYRITDTDGANKSTSNAPFPHGYWRFRHSDGSDPFICPVRECRALNSNLKSAASHFHGRHYRCLMNDNGDGTFTTTGFYSVRNESSPGIVISHDPLPQNALPPAEPDWPMARKKELAEAAQSSSSPTETPGASQAKDPRRVSEASRPAHPTSTGGTMPDRAAKRPRVSVGSVTASVTPVNPPLTSQGGKMLTSEPLRYLHSFLSPKQEVPDRVEIRALARFKKLRDLPSEWITFHRNTVLEPLIYTCSLAYLVGEELSGAKACRRRRSRLSEACVILPSGMLAAEKIAFSGRPTCLSCRYWAISGKKQTDCLWGQMQMLGSGAANDSDSQDGALDTSTAGIEADDQPEALPPPSDVAPSVNGVRPEASVSRPEGDTSEARALRRSARSLSSNVRGELAPEAESEAKSETAPAVSYHAPLIEMEDWEIAPGTFRSDLTGEQMAFSTGYLSTMHPIQVSPDVGLNVSLIKPGTTYHWPVQSDQLRTCFVGSGKLVVKIDGQLFKVGTNGAFVIKPNQKCSAENRLYVEAAVCCNTIQGYELTDLGLD